MKTKVTKQYVNIGLPTDLKGWCDETADKLGLSTTALIIMALSQVREGTERAKSHLESKGVLPKVEDILREDEHWDPDVNNKIRQMKMKV